MMKIKILAIGRSTDQSVNSLVAEYLRRFRKYGQMDLFELPAAKNGLAQDHLMKKKIESESILKALNKGDYVILLDAKGNSYTSEELSAKFEELALAGNSRITFIIGGSYGVSESVQKRADLVMSISKLTFPHLLVRIILVEQLYRSMSIKRNDPYHH